MVMVPTEPIKQQSLAETVFFPKAGKKIRKAMFLVEMEAVVSWSRLEALIKTFYPKKGNGRPPMLLGVMLRIHFMPQRFGWLLRPGNGRCIERDPSAVPLCWPESVLPDSGS